MPRHKKPIIAFPAARTLTDSVLSASVTGVSRGGGVGRIEYVGIRVSSGTGY